MSDSIFNISPLDGRYRSKVQDLAMYFSEAALIRYRLYVEIEWFIFICNEIKLEGTKVWKAAELKTLRAIYENFDETTARRIKEIEKTTNHDVKAVEYFIKEKLKSPVFKPYFEFIHFACTSEDINNLAYAMMVRDGLNAEIVPCFKELLAHLAMLAKKYKNVAMLSRTHGQPATPTTVGKEFVNVLARLSEQLESLQVVKILGKMNGAVGNFNAHVVAYPKVKWIDESNKFIQGLGLVTNFYTTQIEPHDYLAEIFDAMRRMNTVLIDFNRDIWMYISMAYFKQKLKVGEVGSSTMPHKVNPIDFENSEGNLGMANALLGYFSEKLPVSRMQRDLTDSTTLRNIGSAFGYSQLAYKSCIQGLSKLELNKEVIQNDLEDAWELLAEPIQTVMRKHKIEKPYEKLKELTRGKVVNQQTIHKFVDSLKIPAAEKIALKKLTPSTYIGLAAELVDSYPFDAI